MAEIIGHIDLRHRPIVSLVIPDQDDALPVVVDTGFNGELLISEAEAHRLRCEFLKQEAPVDFANGEHRMLALALSSILWFGRVQRVRVWITTAEPRRAALPDEPLGLLGTRLLSPHRLMVDFTERRVVISENQ